MSDLEFKRNEKGDVIFPEYKPDHREDRRWMATYVFHEYNTKIDGYIRYVPIDSADDLIEFAAAIKELDLIKVSLFNFPLHFDRSFCIQYYNFWDAAILNYFKEVFSYDAATEGYHFTIDIHTLYLPKPLFFEISNFINDSHLLHIKDWIFYLIAKIQQTYVKDISFYERPEMVKQINNVKNEVKKAIDVIDRTIEKPRKNGEKYKPLPKLEYIKFGFNPDPVTIEDPWLNHDIIDSFKKYFDELPLKDWKKELERYPHRFDENVQKQQFKNRVAIALHKFFSELKLFKIAAGANTSNAEIRCISKILQYALIRFTDEPDVMISDRKISAKDISKIETENIKRVRVWLKRTELRQYPTHFECKPDYDLLYKHFDKDFINCTLPYKQINTFGEAYYFIKRFDMPEELGHTLAHLYDCFRLRSFQIGHQFSHLPKPENLSPEYSSLRSIIKAISENTYKQNIKEISFKIEGTEETQVVSEKLPVSLIKAALFEYLNDHKEEFEFDLVESVIEENPAQSNYRITNKGPFKQPKDRFLPQFCKSFYSFLLEAYPPQKYDFRISEKYYTIIGLFLNHCWVFGNQLTPEYILVQKVAQWIHNSEE